VDPPELGDRLVVWYQTIQQPHQLDVTATLSLQTSRRAQLMKIAVQIELQQITWLVSRSPSCRWLSSLEAQSAHVQKADKGLDHTANMIDRNQFVQ
jgi:uncharacterized protein YbbK (DUF523 family)